MRLILILLGIAWIVVGLLLVILTDKTKRFFRNLLKQKSLKALSVLPLVIGLVLLSGSRLVSMPWVAILLGLLAALKGLFFIFAPEKKTRSTIDWWLNGSDGLIKTWGVVVFLLGVLLLLIL